MVLPAIERHGPIEAWIIDDTSFPKKGKHSVGRGPAVLRSAGQAGQLPGRGVAVAGQCTMRSSAGGLSALSAGGAGPRMRARRKKAGVPEEIGFQDQASRSRSSRSGGPARGGPAARRGADGCRLRPAHSDLRTSGHGAWLALRRRHPVEHRGVGAWHGPVAASSLDVRAGPPTKRLRRDAEHQPVSVKDLAFSLPSQSLADDHTGERARTSRSRRASRGCASASRTGTSSAREPWPEEWLLIEWPEGREGADQILAVDACRRRSASDRLVDLAKLRWRIERDYQELKQELGLGHFEGRGWRGFHHHATLCIAAYGFLISERETIPPSAARHASRLPPPVIPDSYRPRGAAAAA